MQYATVASSKTSTPFALRTKHPRRTKTTTWPLVHSVAWPRPRGCRHTTSASSTPSRRRTVRTLSMLEIVASEHECPRLCAPRLAVCVRFRHPKRDLDNDLRKERDGFNPYRNHDRRAPRGGMG